MTIQSKKNISESRSLFAGVDVGAEELILLVRKNGISCKTQKFTNTPADRTRLVKKMVGMPGIIVCLEATGVYHFDLSIALHDAGVALMVCSGQVISDTRIALFSEFFCSKAEGDRLPNTECSRVRL